MTDNKQLKPWRQQITATAQSLNLTKLDDAAIAITCDFYFARPKSAKRRIWPTVKSDGDKFLWAILDSCTGVLFRDDAQVVEMHSRKFYGDPERVEITLRVM